MGLLSIENARALGPIAIYACSRAPQRGSRTRSTRRNETALHLACGTGNQNLVTRLLDAGADRTIRNVEYVG